MVWDGSIIILLNGIAAVDTARAAIMDRRFSDAFIGSIGSRLHQWVSRAGFGYPLLHTSLSDLPGKYRR